MKKTKVEKEVQFLKLYAAILTLAVSLIVIFSITKTRQQKFEEIDVERINIIEKEGQLKMVISNQARQHPGISNGKVIEREYPRPPGIIFFNQIGDEMGGIVYGENGKDGHFGSFTWDKFKGDQTIGFRYLESTNGSSTSGISMWQQPNIPGNILQSKYDSIKKIDNEAERNAGIQYLRNNNLLTTNRLFLGKGRDNSTLLSMNDEKGKERIRITVDAKGNPRLEFKDESGNIIYSVPDLYDKE